MRFRIVDKITFNSCNLNVDPLQNWIRIQINERLEIWHNHKRGSGKELA